MIFILKTRVERRDEGVTGRKHQGFLLNHNLADAAGGDASFL